MKNAPATKYLLLRGLTREQRHWGPFLSQFKDKFGADNVFCLDHVGVGTEASRPPLYSVEGMALDLRARWLDLKGSDTSPWVIVSLSMGSMVSLYWCAAFADDFAAQVIMNVSSSTDSRFWNRLLLENLTIIAKMVRASDDQLRERNVLDMCSNLLSDDEKDRLAREWAAICMPKDQVRKVAIAQLWASVRFHRPKKMTVRTLALASAADRLVHPSCTISLAAALDLALEVHPTAGHELSLDDPAWVVEQIASFIKSTN